MSDSSVSPDPTTDPDYRDPELYRNEPVSFVRRGNRLQGRRAKAWERNADRYIIEPDRKRADTSVAEDQHLDLYSTFGRQAPLIVEIGTGLGECIANAAKEDPASNYLAVEVYRPGLAQLMLKVESFGLENVRAIQANAPEVLDVMLEEGSADEIWIFFSDPWHKTRHHKRRLIKAGFLDKVARALKPGGTLRLATDWSNYAEQMRELLESHESFENQYPGHLAGEESNLTRVRRGGLENHEKEPDFVDETGGWAPRFDRRILTSFEGKALKAGRLVFDLAYTRIA
ncbi:tRNA (guanosine(46)-N7)-methyltransferase TrmB [Glutamicibacter sp. MNS18]|uniref:tRNA (guanosine(46)-N7)-methyltransferase TrmB n=1 Tax=Glutamicibacter sp. MNS18 TaxID=2989817 RepID=UPI00223631B3|nr:tRNA (guanosine(46)-N7)-methyltransferase TrmB [Glutamicibacter sp. MNS18]MCW4463978.1 tRNA (guanosine(46)-N7)-methyltransferase TrmB [Glutamicibacter sp. MNS18]